jgi:hypothetical protein
VHAQRVAAIVLAAVYLMLLEPRAVIPPSWVAIGVALWGFIGTSTP